MNKRESLVKERKRALCNSKDVYADISNAMRSGKKSRETTKAMTPLASSTWYNEFTTMMHLPVHK